jgi:hypothetical protein
MIVSFARKFVFAAIPKTGTHAVRQALREHLGPEDIEQVGLFERKEFPIPELAALEHGHISLQQLRPHLSPEQFGSFFKFAFVRNPFDRFVSYCSFMTRAKGGFQANPKAVMAYFLQNPPSDHVLFWPQHRFITDEDGTLLTDYVGRVEEMQQSYDAITRRIGIPTATLARVNSSTRRDYREYYGPRLVDAVARLYARDLELFDYAF